MEVLEFLTCCVDIYIIYTPGECEDTDEEEDHQQPQLLAGLGEGGQQRLQPVEVAHKLQLFSISIILILSIQYIKM